MEIGERLKEARKKKGYTQTEIAKRLGLAKSTLSKYEGDYINLSPDTLKKLAGHYEVSVDYLLGIVEPTSNLVEDLQKISNNLDKEGEYIRNNKTQEEKEDYELLLSLVETAIKLAKRIS